MGTKNTKNTKEIKKTPATKSTLKSTSVPSVTQTSTNQDSMYLDQAFEQVNIELLEMFLKKHADYGKGNILANKELGIAMRISEKVERLKHLLMKSELAESDISGGSKTGSAPANESIEETWIDIAVYAVIGVLYRRKQFQNLEVEGK